MGRKNLIVEAQRSHHWVPRAKFHASNRRPDAVDKDPQELDGMVLGRRTHRLGRKKEERDIRFDLEMHAMLPPTFAQSGGAREGLYLDRSLAMIRLMGAWSNHVVNLGFRV